MTQIVKRTGFIFVVLALLGVGANAFAGSSSRSFLLSNKKGKRPFGLTLDIGGGYNFRTSNFTGILTPPNMTLGEAHLTLWFQNVIGIYGLFGSELTQPGSLPMIYGGGLRLALANVVASKGGLINGISIRLQGDAIYYQFVATPGQIYDQTGVSIRYGVSITWGLFNSPLYLDTTGMLTRFSDVLFMCTFVGLGIPF